MDSELAAQDRDDPDSPMTGTLTDTTPAGVLQVLSSRGSTGAVRFLGDSGCTVYLYDGELYFAENDDTAEDLAVALVRPDRLTASEWDRATASGYPTETVGEALIETGAITRELLASVVLSVIYDPLIALFRAPEGEYEFAPDVVHWMGPYRSFDVDAIVTEVRRRTREADEMTPVVPSLDAVVRSARTLPERHGNVTLRRDDWEVVVAAANGSSVSELAAELGRGRWSTARIVFRLANADLLTVTAEGGFTPDEGPIGGVDDAETSFGLTGDDAPPPLDDLTMATGEDPWGVEDAGDEPAQADPWALGDETDAVDDPWTMPEETGSDEATESVWDGGLAAVPDETGTVDADEGEFDLAELHPDIAKALAESTYADSATAINAMAARLGALDADEDDDEWDTGSSSGESDDGFWAEGTEDAGEEFIWEPAVWDTGVESVPLPQREGERATAQRAAGDDPAWLDNLYSEFMPGDPSDPTRQAQPSEDDAKPRGFKRLISAIRRL